MKNKKIKYKLEIISWENDWDNHKTFCEIYDTENEAIAVKNMCLDLFDSSNNMACGIGNLMKDYGEPKKAIPIILNYLTNHPELLQINNIKTPLDLEDEIKKTFSEFNIKDDWKDYIPNYMDEQFELMSLWINFVMDINKKLLGRSSFYYSRIAESAFISEINI